MSYLNLRLFVFYGSTSPSNRNVRGPLSSSSSFFTYSTYFITKLKVFFLNPIFTNVHICLSLGNIVIIWVFLFVMVTRNHCSAETTEGCAKNSTDVPLFFASFQLKSHQGSQGAVAIGGSLVEETQKWLQDMADIVFATLRFHLGELKQDDAPWSATSLHISTVQCSQ